LEKHGEQEGTMVVQGPGIADAEGLGWPGRPHPQHQESIILMNSQIYLEAQIAFE
jgi:hypothetical protein